jgi:hypothetical protein
MFKIRGRLVKVDPDVFYKNRTGRHATPYRNYFAAHLHSRLPGDYLREEDD